MPFSLHESALFIEAIEAQPMGYMHAAGLDENGVPFNIALLNDYRIHFTIEANGMLFVRDIVTR